ncbi:acyltransferase family protein [Aegicerativicinus sediminis]|uniref:acyltransferase family protein n=1 Tax=Aegicerativicinus sediminis TaxID=2893202 RepID=UPI001E309411|nr:acyltransferase [Aegicerativicinus sediminis]
MNLFFPHDHKPSHIKSLDGLRGLAILLVLVAHLHHFHDNEIFHVLRFYGRAGVYLFFVLSAYLLDRQIIEVFLSKKSSTDYWRYYAKRRFLRIFPLYTVVLIIYLISGVWLDGPGDFVKHLFLLEGKGVFWSIPVEFKYYIFSPLIVWAFYRFTKWNLPLMVAIMTFISLVSLFLFWRKLIGTSDFFQSLPAFFLGTFLAYIDKFNSFEYKKYYKVFEVLSIIGLILIHPLIFKYVGLRPRMMWVTYLYFSPVLLGGIFISAKYGLLKKLFEVKSLRFMGAISFSAYLLHPIIIQAINLLDLSLTIKLIIYPFILVGVCIVTYRFIEYPASKTKQLKLTTFTRNK